MMNKSKGKKGPLIVGFAWGLLMGATPLLQPLDPYARITLALGLALTYLSIGWLVASLPICGPKWSFGIIVGLVYSLPGAVFTMVPYPLAKNAPLYWREFAAGGWRSFGMTLLAGAIVGLTCSFARKRQEGDSCCKPPAPKL